MTSPTKLLSFRNPWHWLATGLWSGLSPKSPGTMGTLASIPFYYLLTFTPAWLYCSIVLLSCVIGVYICHVTAEDMGVHDHGSIVWDEFAGFWITMIPLYFLPTEINQGLPLWQWIVIGFTLFRFFDIVKPWPISWFDKNVAGGLGIMLDDIVAGIISALVLVLIALYGV